MPVEAPPVHVTMPYLSTKMASALPEEDMSLPEHGIAARHCLHRIEDYHLLDFSERLNTSSYVNVVFEPEEEKVASMGLKVNLADQTVYPESFRMHNDTLNMIAKLWHCPKPVDFDKYGCYAGAGTVGSTEACLLAGLALKFRWRQWYAKKHGLGEDEVRGVYPNLVISTMFQAAWEKLFKYMDIQPRFVTPSWKTFTLDPAKLKDVVDEKTIGVVCIMGNHYGGQYDPVWDVDKVLQELNAEKGFSVGIHVDGASGGFVAPFQEGLPPWDFRLQNVLSISASGHKFGNSCCGTGWIVWRQREGLSDQVAINVSYLGGSADSYTLNFSRPAQGVYVQFYKLLRLGFSGYSEQVANQMAVSQYIRDGLLKMERDGKPLFTIIDAVGQSEQKVCLPVVTAMLSPDLALTYDEIDLQHVIAQGHWYVSGYHMSMHHPLNHSTMPLFTDQTVEQAMFRVVVKNNLTMTMAHHLLNEVSSAVDFLNSHDAGFHHRKPRVTKGKSSTLAC
uniref:glutamate decarboxylase n=1 Tax=Alexandrium catenella TaxID=2925 RepID=A0A7S1WC65_ALECA